MLLCKCWVSLFFRVGDWGTQRWIRSDNTDAVEFPGQCPEQVQPPANQKLTPLTWPDCPLPGTSVPTSAFTQLGGTSFSFSCYRSSFLPDLPSFLSRPPTKDPSLVFRWDLWGLLWNLTGFYTAKSERDWGCLLGSSFDWISQCYLLYEYMNTLEDPSGCGDPSGSEVD